MTLRYNSEDVFICKLKLGPCFPVQIVLQGERLVESNFINNTSMVFGQCLRVRPLILDSLELTLILYLFFYASNSTIHEHSYLLAVTVGVPEEPKEGIAETSSKFFGSVFPNTLYII